MLKLKLQYFGYPMRSTNSLDPEAGKDWRQEKKVMTEDEMIGWHHGSTDLSLSKIWALVMNREAWWAAPHGVTKSWTQVRAWTALNSSMLPWRIPRTEEPGGLFFMAVSPVRSVVGCQESFQASINLQPGKAQVLPWHLVSLSGDPHQNCSWFSVALSYYPLFHRTNSLHETLIKSADSNQKNKGLYERQTDLKETWAKFLASGKHSISWLQDICILSTHRI